MLVFRPSGRKPNIDFSVDNNIIEVVTSYKYLGVTISSSGSFQNGIEELSLKGQKAWYMLRSSVSVDTLNNPRLYMKLFDTLITPIITYGAEVWSQQYCTLIEKSNVHSYDRICYEKLHNKVCKQIIGLGKFTSNLAARIELGQVPTSYIVIRRTLNYWSKLESVQPASQCLVSEKELCAANVNSWYSTVQQMLRHVNVDVTALPTAPTNKWCRQQSVQVNDYYHNLQSEQLQSQIGVSGVGKNKLRTYSKLTPRSSQGIEDYLICDLTWKQKRLIAQLRTGNHKLRIETGRHCKPSLPPEQRVCLHCNAACTEDEKHFLAECNAYSEIRKKYLPCEPDSTVDFVNCMTSKDCESLNNLSQYLQEAWELRAGMDQ